MMEWSCTCLLPKGKKEKEKVKIQYNGVMEAVSEGDGKKWNPQDKGPDFGEGEASHSQNQDIRMEKDVKKFKI